MHHGKTTAFRNHCNFNGSAYPLFGIEARGLVAQLEMEYVVTIVVAADGTETLLGCDVCAFGDTDALKSAIDADVGAVTNHDDVLTAILEDAGDGAVPEVHCPYHRDEQGMSET